MYSLFCRPKIHAVRFTAQKGGSGAVLPFAAADFAVFVRFPKPFFPAALETASKQEYNFRYEVPERPSAPVKTEEQTWL